VSRGGWFVPCTLLAPIREAVTLPKTRMRLQYR